jgi:hypothetical protein
MDLNKLFGPTGKPTRQMVFDLASQSGVLYTWLTLWQQGMVTFEEAMMGAVIAYGNHNAQLEDTIKHMLPYHYPPLFVPIKPPVEDKEEGTDKP